MECLSESKLIETFKYLGKYIQKIFTSTLDRFKTLKTTPIFETNEKNKHRQTKIMLSVGILEGDEYVHTLAGTNLKEGTDKTNTV